ncbi:MAG: MerR family transcriptional regulator [Eubacteriales Family XIII. Incertae Sedis bacterium]|nr:MAG: MerR family transcriptional regulator [Clostridiales Family XIII bacterium]
MSYSISEIAEMMNVAPSTIRYYDKIGLLPNIKRKNGIRVFEDEDFEWLRVLNCLKNTNMPLAKIKEYGELVKYGDSSLAERYELIKEQKEKILNEIAKLDYYLKEIEYKEWYYKTAIEAGTESIHDNRGIKADLEPDTIPEK